MFLHGPQIVMHAAADWNDWASTGSSSSNYSCLARCPAEAGASDCTFPQLHLHAILPILACAAPAYPRVNSKTTGSAAIGSNVIKLELWNDQRL